VCSSDLCPPPTTIRNVATLRVKETDRLTALHRELSKLGATVDELPDGLIIRPPDRLAPAAIDTYDDHRMAMSFALAGLKCPGLVINDPQCCAKTFPDFFERFERMIAAGSGPAPG
jgi:3-phosphoshikimate 1-carboxyvinyltransferase